MADKYVYPYSSEEAKSLGELDEWRISHKANIECAETIDKAVREGFDGMYLSSDIAENACKEYGFDRVKWVLANTLQHAEWDGRYRPQNKEWAKETYITRRKDNDNTTDFVLHSHPEIVNGLVNQFRKYYDSLGLFDRSHCESEADGELDYVGKVVVINPARLKDEFKTPEDQLFLVSGGFGSHPNSRGRKVYGEFLKDGEKTYYAREDIFGILKDEYLPEWAKEKLAELNSPIEDEETGMTMH